jgi:hypothetical protein
MQITFRIFDDLGLLPLHYRNGRISRAQVNTNDLALYFLLGIVCIPPYEL